MENKLITLAIHTQGKALILKQVLEQNNIEVYLEKVDDSGNGFYVRIPENKLNKALSAIEENKLFSYSDSQTYKIDDGRSRILVAVDFSNYSFNACRIAFDIAKKNNSKVKILHVYHNIYFPSHIPFADQLKDENEEGLLDRARKQMLDLCNEIDEQIRVGNLPSVNYSYSIREGIVEEEIDLFVKEYKPMLLVVGTKGKDDNKKHILGNVTADIIEMVNVPVLTVPDKMPIDLNLDVKHMVFLTNLQERDLTSFNTLVSIINPVSDDMKITLLHLNLVDKRGNKWPEAELIGMKKYFEEHYPNMNVEYKLIDAPDMLQAVAEFIEKEKVGVVALNTRKRTLFGRIFLPSMSRKVLSRINVALLVLRG
ncbi:MAG: universal stress protein [Dysgonomonas sp.]|nr:universal stress protein [Dysgonomonas sp.]